MFLNGNNLKRWLLKNIQDSRATSKSIMPYAMQTSVKDGNHLIVVTMFGHSFEGKAKNVNENIYAYSKTLNLTMDFNKLKTTTHSRDIKGI